MTIYLITAYDFNHGINSRTKQPLDDRFLKSNRNYQYYLIDEGVPDILRSKSVLFEKKIDPQLAIAGKKHFGEWAFLLAEAKHSFCKYPFFMVSSRFYQKNNWIYSDLNKEWDTLFQYLERYGWGFLPSYDRPLRWIDLKWKNKIGKPYLFFPFTEKTFHLLQDLYQVQIPDQYTATSDLFCNYIGFHSREHLLSYVNFYQPLVETFFDENYNLKIDISEYASSTGHFQNEKPFTFILELFSHLFFYKTEKPFFTLHYDGYYEVNESKKTMSRIKKFPLTLSTKANRFFDWQWRKVKTDGVLAPLFFNLGKIKRKYLSKK